MKLTKDHGLLIARVCLALVFIWFGIGKFQDDVWAETMRGMPMMQHMQPAVSDTLVYIVGATEIIIGVFLAAGLFLRTTAVIAALELFFIFFVLKVYEVRDLGLIGALILLAIEGNGIYGIQMLRRQKGQ